MRRILLLMLIIGAGGLAQDAAWALADEPPEGANGVVIHMRLDNVPITPVSARFIARGIREAEEAGARCLIIELDTPGGLVESTQGIVKNIIASRVPVAVYVSPSGRGRPRRGCSSRCRRTWRPWRPPPTSVQRIR